MRLAIFLCASVSVAFAQSAPPLEQVLSGVRANLAEFDASMPDFVTIENMTSKAIDGRKTRMTTTAESVFTCVRPRGARVRTFSESREVLTQDGKPAVPGQLRNTAVFTGGFSSLAGDTFAEQNARDQEFSLGGIEAVDGRPAIVWTSQPNQ